MSLKDRAKATAKDIEGRLQEKLGDITGNLKAQAEGHHKRLQAEAMRTTENIENSAKK